MYLRGFFFFRVFFFFYTDFLFFFVFFFQAEDGIRDRDVTGVQTCALPIYRGGAERIRRSHPGDGGTQEIWRGEETDRGGLPSRTVSSANSRASSRGGRRRGHRRSRAHPGSGRRRFACSARAAAGVSLS